MSSLFDGVSGLINDVFGAPLTYTPKFGLPREIRAIFRGSPVDLVDADGIRVRDLGPTLRLRRGDAPDIGRGDQITLSDGRRFEVDAVWPYRAPASDGFLVCDLTEVSE